MRERAFLAPFRNPALSLGGALLLALLIVLAWKTSIFIGGLRLDQIEARDSRGYNAAQLMLEYQRLDRALLDAIIGAENVVVTASVDEVKLRLNIYLGRMDLVAGMLNPVGSDKRIAATLMQLEDSANRALDLLNAEDQPDLAQLEAVLGVFRRDEALVRNVTMLSLQRLAAVGQIERESYNQALMSAILAGLSLIGLLIVAVAMLIWLLFRLSTRERVLKGMSANQRTMLDASLDATIVTDAAGAVTWVNAAGARLFGQSNAKLAETRIEDIVDSIPRPEETSEGGQDPFVTVDSPPHRDRQRMQAKGADGAVIPVEVSRSVGRQAGGEMMIIHFIRDLTEQDAATAALRSARDQAQMATRAKDRFIAVMSHEMRTPLMGVVAALDLLQGESDHDEKKLLLRTARACSLTSLQQIEDVLELARLDADTEAIQTIDPIMIAQGLLREMKPLADLRGNTLTIQASGVEPYRQLLGLPQTYRRVLSNLVANGVKFTQNGLVLVEITAEAISDHEIKLRTLVSDNGIGISPADRLRIFDEFEVVTQTVDSTVPGGSGLGLAIVKRGVQHMGGIIMLEGNPGRGTTFWFDITVLRDKSKPTSNAFPEVALPSDQKRRVLVVDDNMVNRTVLSRMVLRLGHDVTLAETGAMAIELARETLFDLILMDINLPCIDGLEASRLIRLEGNSIAAVIVGITAEVRNSQRERMADCGMSMLVAKPSTLRELEECIDEAFSAGVSVSPFETVMDQDASERETLQELVGRDLYCRLFAAALDDVDKALESWPITRVDLIEEQFHEHLHRALGSAGMIREGRIESLLRRAAECAHKDEVSGLVDLRYMLLEEMTTMRLRSPAQPG